MTASAMLRINSAKVTHEMIDNEVIAIHFESGSYYSMTGSAAAIWSALEAGSSPALLTAALAGTPCVQAGLAGFLKDLADEELIVEESGEPTPSGSFSVPDEAPLFHKYTDMQQLLLADPLHEVEPSGWPNTKTNG